MVMALVLIFGIQAAYAADVDVVCPGSVSPGDSLSVTVTVTNDEPENFSFSRVATGLSGVRRTVTSLSDVGIMGPFARHVGPYTLLPGTSTTFTVTVVTIPSGMPPQFAGVFVAIVKDDGEVGGAGGCAVEVVP